MQIIIAISAKASLMPSSSLGRPFDGRFKGASAISGRMPNAEARYQLWQATGSFIKVMEQVIH
jgi:hypothetical protein